MRESSLLEKRDRLGASHPALAMNHDPLIGIELGDPLGKFRKRDHGRPGDPADGDFLGVANIEDERGLTTVHLLLQLSRGDCVGHRERLRGLTFRSSYTAKFLVIDQSRDRWVRSADGTLGILADLHLADRHVERVVEHQSAHQGPTLAENELYRLGRLHNTDESRQDPQYASLGAVGHEVRRWRFGVKAAIARTVRRMEDRGLAIEPKDRAINVRLAEQDAGVVYQIARWEVIGAVDDHVVLGKEFEGVGAVDRVLRN